MIDLVIKNLDTQFNRKQKTVRRTLTARAIETKDDELYTRISLRSLK